MTVYYLLAEHFGKLDLFGGAAGAAAPVARLADAAPPEAPADELPVVPAAASSADHTGAAPLRPQALASGIASGGGAVDNGGFLGFAAVVFAGAATIMLVSAIAGSYVAGRFDKEARRPLLLLPHLPRPLRRQRQPGHTPEGAGVIAEVIEGRPKVSVYFASGQSAIAPDFAAAVGAVKAWLAANPADRVQLSGFSDPTGNAAANAALAKSRAQAVEAALVAEGVAADRIDLVKPEDSSDEAADLAGARRVEITVTPG